MSVFLTGATGFIGSYVTRELLAEHGARLSLLVRAASDLEARQRLWKSLQLHMDFDAFAGWQDRIDIVLGDLTQPGLGLEDAEYARLAGSIESVIHCAASLNRRSSKVCFNVNLRGTLEIVKLAQRAGSLRRFSDVSTVAVAGARSHELVGEDEAIDWQRSDYDPYARTKKFCEHMVQELLPDVPVTVFRPSITMGDSRFAATSQFEMVRAFAMLADLPVLPFHPDWRIDIVPADFVGDAIASVHMREAPQHGVYHLSAGEASLSLGQIVTALARAGISRRPRFVPRLNGSVGSLVSAIGSIRRRHPVTQVASLLEVFWPYITNDTVFDNRRICAELGTCPTPFDVYAADLYRYAKRVGFTFPALSWPQDGDQRIAPPSPRRVAQ